MKVKCTRKSNPIHSAKLTHAQWSTTQGSFADSEDQDQTAQNVQSDPRSSLSDKEIFLRLCNISICSVTTGLTFLSNYS